MKKIIEQYKFFHRKILYCPRKSYILHEKFMNIVEIIILRDIIQENCNYSRNQEEYEFCQGSEVKIRENLD